MAARPEAGAPPAGPPLADLAWRPCHRLIPSRFPTVGLYDRVADPADLDVVFAIESLTNPRLRQEAGQIHLVPAGQRVTGAGASLIMAAFTHLNPLGSRFSDGRWGVYYAADSLMTAVAEVSHHRALFMTRTQEPAIDLDMRWIKADLKGRLHDLRVRGEAPPAVLDPDDYTAGQALARRLRDDGSAGIVYPSVRRAEGQCAAVFRPTALSRARAAGHIGLHWDGQRITHWYEKGPPRGF